MIFFFVMVCVRNGNCNGYVLFFQDMLSTKKEEQVECDVPRGGKASTLKDASAEWQRY